MRLHYNRLNLLVDMLIADTMARSAPSFRDHAAGASSAATSRQALDPNCFIRVELPPDLLFNGKHEAQMCKTIPALKIPNPYVVGNHRRVAISCLS